MKRNIIVRRLKYGDPTDENDYKTHYLWQKDRIKWAEAIYKEFLKHDIKREKKIRLPNKYINNKDISKV